MMVKRPPIGQRICQECDTRLIPSVDLACAWCWRAMTVDERDRLRWERPSARFIVPIALSPSSSNDRKKLFRSLVQTSYPKEFLFRGPIAVEVVVVKGGASVEVVIEQVLEGLKGWAWPYKDSKQVKELTWMQGEGEGPRTEITIRGLA